MDWQNKNLPADTAHQSESRPDQGMQSAAYSTAYLSAPALLCILIGSWLLSQLHIVNNINAAFSDRLAVHDAIIH
jgi:hypothetical protein